MNCLLCGKDFIKYRKWQKFCSPKCQMKYWGIINHSHLKEYQKYYKRTYSKEVEVIKVSDNYIKNLIVGKRDLLISYKDIPPKLIELKRAELLLKRSIKKESGKCQVQS